MKKVLFASAVVAALMIGCMFSLSADAVGGMDGNSLALLIFIFIFCVAVVSAVAASIISQNKKKKERDSYDFTNDITPAKVKKNKNKNTDVIKLPVSDLVPNNYTEIINAEIRKHDEDFSGAKFCDWGKNVLIRMLTSLTENHLAEMRSLETDKLFYRHGKEINDALAQGKKNVYKNIIINRAYLQLYMRNSSVEHLTMYAYGNMQCYMANAVTDEPLPGYLTDRQKFKYLLTFERSVKAKTVLVNGIQAMVCQSCGAPVDDVSDIRCDYCGSELKICEHNWILCDVKAMTNNIPLDDRGIVIF